VRKIKRGKFILRFLRIVSPKVCALAEDIAVSLVKIMRIVITVT